MGAQAHPLVVMTDGVTGWSDGCHRSVGWEEPDWGLQCGPRAGLGPAQGLDKEFASRLHVQGWTLLQGPQVTENHTRARKAHAGRHEVALQEWSRTLHTC